MDLDSDDLDLDSDKVRSFLKHKLEEIRANNVRLERTITERKRHLQAISKKEDAMDESSTGISYSWKKIFNGRYALGFTLQNDSGKILSNLRTFCKWTSQKPLFYEFGIFDVKVKNTSEDIYECGEENCKLITRDILKSKAVHSLAHLVFVIDIPNFTDSLCIELCGLLICQSDDGQEIKLAIPEVPLAAGDATNRELCNWPITDGDKNNLLAALCSSRQIDLLLVFSEHWSSTIDSTFEIHCSLRKIDLIDSCKNYYVAHGLSQMIDGSVVEIHERKQNSTVIPHMKIYYREEESLICLLHHLHQGIAGVTILPMELYHSYMLQNSTTSSEEDVFGELEASIKKEIKLVDNFLKSFKKDQRSFDDVARRKFISTLTDLESQTDLIYLKICNLNKTPRSPSWERVE